MTSSFIVDPTTDPTRKELARLSRVYEFPEYVKQADINQTMSPENIARSSYADPVRSIFPCHTKAATILSSIYFHDKANNINAKTRSQIENRLKAAASYFGVLPDYQDIVKQASNISKPQLPDSSYALIWESDDGRKEYFYPMTDGLSTKAAAEWLYSVRDRVPFPDRNVAGSKIRTKALQYAVKLGEDLQDFIDKQAGYGIPDPPRITQAIEDRARLAKTAEQRQLMLKLADTVKTTPQVALHEDSLVKLAETLEMYDWANGLLGRYTETIPRPEDVVFTLSLTKAAEHFNKLFVLTNGDVYEKSQLAKLASDDLSSVFGTEFVRRVSDGFGIGMEKLATAASQLDHFEADAFSYLLQEKGQYPQDFKSPAKTVISDETLDKLAAAYCQQT